MNFTKTSLPNLKFNTIYPIFQAQYLRLIFWDYCIDYFLFCRLPNVLRFVTLNLHFNSKLRPPILKDLCQVFKTLGVTFDFCAGLVVSAENNSDLCKGLASVAGEDLCWKRLPNTANGNVDLVPVGVWNISRPSYLSVAAEMMQHVRPRTLIRVYLQSKCTEEEEKDLRKLLFSVRKFRGKLGFEILPSLDNFMPIDDILLQFNNSG